MRKRTYFKESTEITDSEGNVLTQEQINFFKNSKARNRKGQLLVCYHGTPTPGFTEFNPGEAKSQFGDYKFEKYNVNYFTTNLDTARGYTQIGVGDVDDKYKNIYAVYLNIQNPYIVDNTTEAEIKSWKNIKDKNIRNVELKAFDAFIKKWSRNDSDIYDVLKELNRDLRKFNHALRENESDPTLYDLCDLGNNSMWGAAHPVMWAYETVDELLDDEDRLKEVLVGVYDDDRYIDDYVYTLDYITGWVLYLNEEEGANYDGIIVEDILDIGPHGSMFGEATTDIITLKSGNQIKSIKNKVPSSSNNINEDKDKVTRMHSYREALEDYQSDDSFSEVKFHYDQLERYYHSLLHDNDSFEAAKIFFDSEDWFDFKGTVRDCLESLSDNYAFADFHGNSQEKRESRLTIIKVVDLWNHFATLAKDAYDTALDDSDDDAYAIMFNALDTDGWAEAPFTSKMITL